MSLRNKSFSPIYEIEASPVSHMIEISLNSLKTFYESVGMSCVLQSQDSLNWLEIRMGVDEAKRPKTLVLLVIEKDSSSEQNFGYFIQFRYLFPFTVQKETIPEMARFILLLNKVIEFPGFGFSESDGKVYFRHDLHSCIKRINEDLLKGVLGYILFMIDSYGPVMESLAEKKKTLNQILKEGV